MRGYSFPSEENYTLLICKDLDVPVDWVSFAPDGLRDHPLGWARLMFLYSFQGQCLEECLVGFPCFGGMSFACLNFFATLFQEARVIARKSHAPGMQEKTSFHPTPSHVGMASGGATDKFLRHYVSSGYESGQ